MKTLTYSAPWGARVRWITAGLLALFVTIPLVLAAIGGHPWQTLALVDGALFLLMSLGAAAFWIRSYELTDAELHILRPGWRARLPLAGLREVKADREAFRGAWKTIGNDGFFAIHGRFRSKRWGSFRAFLTDPANAVVLRFDDRVVLVSPDNPAGFVREVTRRLEALAEGRR